MQKFLILIVIQFVFLITACAPNSSLSINKSKVQSGSASHANFEQRFIDEVNKVRARPRKCGSKTFSAAPKLVVNKKLTLASYNHSLDMSKNQFLEHTSSNGDSLVSRMRDVNYIWSAVGENLAHNQKTIQQVIQDWLSSPGHCSNLMSADYSQAGIAVVDWYWTQVYASPK